MHPSGVHIKSLKPIQESVVPLTKRRDLRTLLRAAATPRKSLLSEAKQRLKALGSSPSFDDAYLYYEWLQQNVYWTLLPAANYRKRILEREEWLDEKRRDERYLELWLETARSGCATKAFAMMWRHGIGVETPTFYIELSSYLEADGRRFVADFVLREGMQRVCGNGFRNIMQVAADSFRSRWEMANFPKSEYKDPSRKPLKLIDDIWGTSDDRIEPEYYPDAPETPHVDIMALQGDSEDQENQGFLPLISDAAQRPPNLVAHGSGGMSMGSTSSQTPTYATNLVDGEAIQKSFGVGDVLKSKTMTADSMFEQLGRMPTYPGPAFEVYQDVETDDDGTGDDNQLDCSPRSFHQGNDSLRMSPCSQVFPICPAGGDPSHPSPSAIETSALTMELNDGYPTSTPIRVPGSLAGQGKQKPLHDSAISASSFTIADAQSPLPARSLEFRTAPSGGEPSVSTIADGSSSACVGTRQRAKSAQ